MSDAFLALRDAVLTLIKSERQNLEAGTHRSATGELEQRVEERAERLRARDAAIVELRRIAKSVLAAGIKGGFPAETAEERLEELIRSAEDLTKWETGLRPIDDENDERAFTQWEALRECVERRLGAVMNMAVGTTIRKRKVKHDPKMVARNKWLHSQASKKNQPTWKALMFAVNERAERMGWEPLHSVQGVQKAVRTHIKQNNLNPLPPRKNG